nr:hypothetical protein [Tanacetum cinerariifolium]
VGCNSATRIPNVVNACLESFRTVSKAHGIRYSASANEENTNDAGTVNDVANNGTTVGPALAESGCELIKKDVGNIPVWVKLHGVPSNAFSEDGLSVIATKLDTSLMLDSYTSDMCIQSWDMSSYDIALIEIQADVELKHNIVVAMLKLIEEGFYTCNNECPINIDSDVVKNIKKPSQTPRCVPVGPKMGFKPVNQVYIHVSKKNTVNTSGDKKKDVEPTIDVSISNLFDVLNSVENDVNLDMNGETSNLAKKANFSGSSLIIDEKVTLVDDEDKPLTKVDSLSDYDSENEVASVDNNMANFLASKKVGYGINSLLEQWKETHENGDYDFEPYDDNMYEGQDIPDKIQNICDNLDIKIRGRKKK